MLRNYQIFIFLSVVSFGFGLIVGGTTQFTSIAEAQTSDRVFELRTYTTHPGRLGELHSRFADHTVTLFERHGMTNMGYFQPTNSPLADNTLIYLLMHDSQEAAEASWAAFRADPEWLSAAEESRRDGRLVQNVDSVFLEPTYYSMMN
ncbi:MAG: NIPSNAP family protein [Gammaproteobacteria bacterium]|nr:NIPSNAP family protein [Gammaproteobacteria bacterium]